MVPVSKLGAPWCIECIGFDSTFFDCFAAADDESAHDVIMRVNKEGNTLHITHFEIVIENKARASKTCQVM